MERQTFIDQLVHTIETARAQSDGLIDMSKPYLVITPHKDAWRTIAYRSLSDVARHHPLLRPNIVHSLGGEPLGPLYEGKAALLDVRELPAPKTSTESHHYL